MHGAAIRVCSGNYVTARPIGVVDGVDFRHTGMVRKIDASALQQQLNNQHIVILSPIGYSPTGEVFNLTAEDVAVHTAATLKADKLILFTCDEGLLNSDGQLIRQCEYRDVDSELIKQPLLKQDSIVQAVVEAGDIGINRCHMVSFQQDGALLQELFTRDGAGTLITQEHYEQFMTADIDDVGGLLAIVKTLTRTSRKRNKPFQNSGSRRHGRRVCSTVPVSGTAQRRDCLCRHPPRLSRRRSRRASA
jgi:amino-acid N-acetyltransferase